MSGYTPEPISQRAEFRQLADQMDGVAIWIAAELGTFDYVSEGFEAIWGVPAGAVEDDIDRMVGGVHPDDRDQMLSAVEQAADELADVSFEHRVVQPDGTVRWVQAHIFPLLDDENDLTELVGLSTDITDQKRREEELAVLNRILRHDIRNDMNVVLGRLATVETQVGGELRETVQRSIAAGEHVVELTDLAREYVDVVVEDDVFDRSSVALATAIEDELTLQREACPDATFRIDGSLPDVEILGNELVRSVFRNVLVNAVQHNDEPEPVVTVSTTVEPETVRVAVADNGPGVADDRKELIFGKGIEDSTAPAPGWGSI